MAILPIDNSKGDMRHHFASIIGRFWVASAAILLFATPVANAQTSKFGGAYQVGAISTPKCVSKNLMTGDCSCVGGVTADYDIRVLTDAGVTTKQGSNVKICAPGSADISAEFAGAFWLNDFGTCLAANKLSNACYCPAGTTTQKFRTVWDSPSGTAGAYLGICSRVTSTPTAFGGAYQIDDTVPGGLGCRASNYDTGACSCPSNFVAQPVRTLVDTASGIIGSTINVCVPRNNNVVQLCTVNGQPVLAETSTYLSASTAIQTCIDNTPSGGTLELPIGRYLITNQLLISKPITLRSKGTVGVAQTCGNSLPCATLAASSDLYAPNGIITTIGLNARAVDGVTIDHLIVDGNRANRLSSAAYTQCKAGNGGQAYGYNSFIIGNNFKLTYTVWENALCGRGFAYSGDNATISNNVFTNNGDNKVQNAWADGLTVMRTFGSQITNNIVTDNTDVGLIIGGARSSWITGNTVSQTNARAFAAMMLNSMGEFDADSGDFSDTTVSGNIVTCGSGFCHIAFNVGDHAWTSLVAYKPVVGGTISNNTVTGGVLGLNIDGAGSVSAPWKLSGNSVGAPVSGPAVSCGPSSSKTIYPSRFNVYSADSKVITSDTIHSNQQVHECNGS